MIIEMLAEAPPWVQHAVLTVQLLADAYVIRELS